MLLSRGTASMAASLSAALIFTQRSNEERRTTQRVTWLKHHWQRGEVRKDGSSSDVTPLADRPASNNAAWRYIYVLARDGREQASELDRVVGDTVTLSAVTESYANLVYKTLEAAMGAGQCSVWRAAQDGRRQYCARRSRGAVAADATPAWRCVVHTVFVRGPRLQRLTSDTPQFHKAPAAPPRVVPG